MGTLFCFEIRAAIMNTYPYPLSSVPKAAELIKNARAIVADGKGILAADESTGTIGKRFANISVENNLENRIAYREALFTAPKELSEYIGGTILYEETLESKGSDGRRLVEGLVDKGIILGIKTDKGVRELAGTNGETVTQGIDGMLERCQKYYEAGCRFCKWRAVIKIGAGAPTQNAIQQNAYTLARYASISQQAGLVPIVEPETLVLDGDHDINISAKITQEVISAVYRELIVQNVLLEGTLLKPNMVLAGRKCAEQPSVDQVAELAMRVLRNTVPPAVAGITFLSGGMSEEEATQHLNAINRVPGPRPWAVTFSYGRALQASCLKAWSGKKENVDALHKELLQRAKANRDAALGKYGGDAPIGAAGAESLYVENYKY